jgi:hypothetical protein
MFSTIHRIVTSSSVSVLCFSASFGCDEVLCGCNYVPPPFRILGTPSHVRYAMMVSWSTENIKSLLSVVSDFEISIDNCTNLLIALSSEGTGAADIEERTKTKTRKVAVRRDRPRRWWRHLWKTPKSYTSNEFRSQTPPTWRGTVEELLVSRKDLSLIEDVSTCSLCHLCLRKGWVTALQSENMDPLFPSVVTVTVSWSWIRISCVLILLWR